MPQDSRMGRISYRSAEKRSDVATAWNRLQAWSNTQLPDAKKNLRKPASAKALAKLTKAIGRDLPADVAQSFAIHDGEHGNSRGILFSLQLLPVEDVLREWHSWVEGWELNIADGSADDFNENCTSFPEGWVQPLYFHRGWIPLTYDSGGNHIAVDLDPGPAGTVGQVIIFGRDDEFHPVLARSWSDFLNDVADEFESGNVYVDRSDPDYGEFTLDAPRHKHFHTVGMPWSRAKLGLRRLKKADQAVWDRRGGK